MYMHACVVLCVYVYMYVCMYMYVYVCIWYVCIYVYYTWICVWMIEHGVMGITSIHAKASLDNLLNSLQDLSKCFHSVNLCILDYIFLSDFLQVFEYYLNLTPYIFLLATSFVFKNDLNANTAIITPLFTTLNGFSFRPNTQKLSFFTQQPAICIFLKQVIAVDKGK